ncbi:hypothetical protein H0H92_007237 [Tricholoma furcatifolium]|nr:hypothetical protein H0H92_007237 [Tricholoma furcatifolium]
MSSFTFKYSGVVFERGPVVLKASSSLEYDPANREAKVELSGIAEVAKTAYLALKCSAQLRHPWRYEDLEFTHSMDGGFGQSS